jgi:hypothetical protein
MPVAFSPVRKRPVNLTLNESLVMQAKTYTSNLSATMELLLIEFVWRTGTRCMPASAPSPMNTSACNGAV